MISRLKVVSAVSVLAMATALCACGSSKSSSTGSTPTTQTGSSQTTVQATGAPIHVGVVCSCSGAFGSTFVGDLDVYKAWVNTINGSGGVNGHPVDLTVEDDSSTPGTSVSDLQTLVSDHVDAVLDLSVVDETWSTNVKAANIPVVGGNIVEGPFYTNSDFFSSGETEDAAVYATIATAKAADAKNIGQLYCAEAAVCAEGVPVFEADGKKLGVPDIYNGEISATAPNYTAQCVAAQQDHVQSLFIGQVGAVVERVGQDCVAQGYKPIYVTQGNGTDEGELTSTGTGADLWSPWNDLPFFDTHAPGVQAMNAAVTRYYPTLSKNQSEYTGAVSLAWTSGLLLADAVKAGGLQASGTPSASEITTGLYALSGDTLGGMAPPLTFKQGQPNPVDCWFTSETHNQISSMADNSAVTCENGTSS